MYNVTHYLLTPDKAASRRVRRCVAENGSRLGVIVGTWQELISFIQQNYHVPQAIDSWESCLQISAVEIKDAFWSQSLEVAENETLAVLSHSLIQLLEGTASGKPLALDSSGILPQRACRHLNDLIRLHTAMGSILPARFSAISDLLSVTPPASARKIVIYRQDEIMQLSPRHIKLLQKIADDFPASADPVLQQLYSSSLTMHCSEATTSSLFFMQHNLFSTTSEKKRRDDSFQVIAARDYLAEVEVTAGMIQELLCSDSTISFSDFGVLLPSDSIYAISLHSVFTMAGLPVSGLSFDISLRDIGRETVYHFLLAVQKPAPFMALASLVTSPLMPWSSQRGIMLADSIMNGDTDCDEINHLTRHIQGDTIIPAELDAALLAFSRTIQGNPEMEMHRGRARQTITELRAMLQDVEKVPWKELYAVTAPESYSRGNEHCITQEGTAIFNEHEEPWRPVKHLFVLGFSAGHYPATRGTNAVFAESDLELLNMQLNYSVETAADYSKRQRELFKRQLSSVGTSLTILMPRRDGMGEAIHPSETLTFMAQLIDGISSPEDLVYDLDSSADRDKVSFLPRAEKCEPVPPRTLVSEDITLPYNLLKLRADKDGVQKPESPSGLETLMVSPLAWLFRRFNLEPKEWTPEELDMMGKGTLAHSVFENLFAPGKKIPAATEIKKQIPELLYSAIRNLMPFLLSPEWRVERKHLERDIEDAALRWSDIIKHLNAEVVGVEVKLHGMLENLPLTGNADLLLKLPNDRLYVVDYKKSKSKSRRERMSKGYDSQANLYRIMLKTGGIVEETPELGTVISSCKEIGAMYYMLNDQTALADTTGWSGGTTVGFQELGSGISTNAMALIKERIEELEKGIVTLNTVDDEEWFNKTAGTTPYALDNSPLIRLFMKQE